MTTAIFRKKAFLLPIAALSFLVFIVFSQQVMADMFGWFKKTEVQLSPEVNGTVTLNGKPVAGATIQQSLSYGDKEFNDHAITDAEGRFKFPAKSAKFRVSSMFDTWLSQLLVVEHAGQSVKIWSTGATNTLTYDSVRQLLFNMQCELTSPEMKIGIPRSNPQSPPLWLVSICNFERDNIIIEKELNI